MKLSIVSCVRVVGWREHLVHLDEVVACRLEAFILRVSDAGVSDAGVLETRSEHVKVLVIIVVMDTCALVSTQKNCNQVRTRKC